MNTNVYVGARYVPKFADPIEWNAVTAYEPLTVVTYQGASYTSKTHTPVGVPVTNTNYWVVTGNYNAQVEAYRQDVFRVADEVEKVAKRTAKEFDGKWLIVSDSYGLPYNSKGVMGEGGHWGVKLANQLGLASDQYWDLCEGGTGFWDSGWYNNIVDWVNANPTEVENIKHIVIAGGYNDSTEAGVGTIIPGMSALSTYCKTTFQNAEVYLAYIGWCLEPLANMNGHSRTWREVAQSFYALAPFHGINYLAGCEGAIHDKRLMDEDGIHPHKGGGDYIATALRNALKTGYGAINKPTEYGTFVPVGGFVNGTVKQKIIGQTVYTRIEMSIAGIDPNGDGSGVTLPVADWGVIGDINLPYGNSIPVQNVQITYAHNLVYKTGNFDVKIEDGKLYLKSNSVTDDGSTFVICTFDALNPFVINATHSVTED